jgi:phosphoketolase
MGQGRCVAAVDSVNLLVDNMSGAHAARYAVSDEGLTRYVRDFYSYRLGEDGRQDSPLGSHVNDDEIAALDRRRSPQGVP